MLLALVGWCVVTAVQGDGMVGLLGMIPGAVNAAATTLTASGMVRRAERLVTPVIDPRDDDGNRLVPEPATEPPSPQPARNARLFGLPVTPAVAAGSVAVAEQRRRRRQVTGRHADPAEPVDSAGDLFSGAGVTRGPVEYGSPSGGVCVPREVADGDYEPDRYSAYEAPGYSSCYAGGSGGHSSYDSGGGQSGGGDSGGSCGGGGE